MAYFQSRRRPGGRNRGRARALALGLTAALAPALTLGATAFAGPVRGSLSLPRDVEPAAKVEGAPDHYWRVWNGVLEPLPEPRFEPSRELAVVLTGEATGDPIGCGGALRGGDLLPSTLAVRAGASLRVENGDGCAHWLFAEGVDGFEPVETPPGNARAVPIREAGHWVIRDASHPHVQGHLHALPDLVACGTVDARGGYTFPSVPAGDYTLKVLRGSDEVGSRPLTVPEAREQSVPPIELAFPATR